MDSREFRNALGCFATGITVITAFDGETPVGLTANSFTSLSLDPPLVLWCLDRSSEMLGIFTTADRFAINVLAADQEMVSRHFARKYRHAFEDIPFERGKTGAPLLTGALARFDCTLEARHDGGDHLIIVGRVMAFDHRPGAPLLYSRGKYAHLAEVV
jgi:flavin reductase (DIM6/NTAB) family NADH-FMN oxidoreductase RutF